MEASTATASSQTDFGPFEAAQGIDSFSRPEVERYLTQWNEAFHRQGHGPSEGYAFQSVAVALVRTVEAPLQEFCFASPDRSFKQAAELTMLSQRAAQTVDMLFEARRDGDHSFLTNQYDELRDLRGAFNQLGALTSILSEQLTLTPEDWKMIKVGCAEVLSFLQAVRGTPS